MGNAGSDIQTKPRKSSFDFPTRKPSFDQAHSTASSSDNEKLVSQVPEYVGLDDKYYSETTGLMIPFYPL